MNLLGSVADIGSRALALLCRIRYRSIENVLRTSERRELEKLLQRPESLETVVSLARYGSRSARRALFHSSDVRARAAFQLWADEDSFSDDIVRDNSVQIRSRHTRSIHDRDFAGGIQLFSLKRYVDEHKKHFEFKSVIDLIRYYQGTSSLSGSWELEKTKAQFSRALDDLSNRQRISALREHMRWHIVPYVSEEYWGKQGVLDAQLYLANQGYLSDWLRVFFARRENIWELLSSTGKGKAMDEILDWKPPSGRSCHKDARDRAGDDSTRALFYDFFWSANIDYYLVPKQIDGLIECMRQRVSSADSQTVDMFQRRMGFIRRWHEVMATAGLTSTFESHFNYVWERYRRGHDFLVKARNLADKEEEYVVGDAVHGVYGTHHFKVVMSRIELMSGKKVVAYHETRGGIRQDVYRPGR